MEKKNILLIALAIIFLLFFTLIYNLFLKSQKHSIDLDGQKREYLLHTQKSSEKLPLVIALHGYKDNPRLMEFYSGLSRKADKEKFIVVYPYGSKNEKDKNLSWNGGSCCGNGVTENIDDLKFINNLTDELIKNENVDPKRIYIVGFSNGGLLAYKLASETPEKYKAVAVVSGSIGGKVYKNLPEYIIPNPKKPISILVMHGMKDGRIPYNGGANANNDGSFKSFEESKILWAKSNGCVNSPKVENNLVIHESFPICKDGVKTEYYSVKNSGHVWPGSVLELKNVIKHQAFPATDTIWNFFKSQSR